jgi:pimeloyl-ACP methyl ester carboxylesterase
MSTARAAAVERGSLLAGGTRTRLVQAGPGEASEAVVFVHGNPGSADDWAGFVGTAAGTGKRAVAFDLPDFGETVAPDGFEHDVPGYAAFVDAALRELGVERAHLVLHDFGGPIGLYWAAAHPDAVASVTLIDTGILPGYRWHSLARIWRTPILGEIFQATATRSAFRFLLNRTSRGGCRASSSKRCTTTTTAAPAGRCWRSTGQPTTPAGCRRRWSGCSPGARSRRW